MELKLDSNKQKHLKIFIVSLLIICFLGFKITNANIKHKTVKYNKPRTPTISKKHKVKDIKHLTYTIKGYGTTIDEINKKQKQNINWINIICTAYSASKDECGSNNGVTASGTKASNLRGTIATPIDIKFQTHIYIEGLNKTFVAEDRGNPDYIRRIDDNTIHIDIFMNSKQEAKNFGIRKYRGYIVK